MALGNGWSSLLQLANARQYCVVEGFLEVGIGVLAQLSG